jgi:hypothetical protein
MELGLYLMDGLGPNLSRAEKTLNRANGQ